MGILAWIHPAVLAEYALGLGVRVRRSARGQHRHRGTVPEILHACVDACWDGRWYVASPGHFRMFWTRDLAFAARPGPIVGRKRPDGPGACVARAGARGVDPAPEPRHHDDPLLRPSRRCLRVRGRLGAAPPCRAQGRRGRRPGRTPPVLAGGRGRSLLRRGRRPFDRPGPGRPHLQRPPGHGRRRFDGLRQLDGRPAPQDPGRDRLARLARRPLPRRGPGRLLRERFWRGDRFIDRLGTDDTSGEANVWPFWTGVIGDREMLGRRSRRSRGRASPTPSRLRYETSRRPEREVWVTRHLLPNYQGSTIWTSIGSMYLWLLHALDPPAAEAGIRGYADWIRRDGTFWEVLDEDGRCWVSPRRAVHRRGIDALGRDLPRPRGAPGTGAAAVKPCADLRPVGPQPSAQDSLARAARARPSASSGVAVPTTVKWPILRRSKTVRLS